MGEALRISGYLGESDTFDKAIAAFSIAYADQVESDYDAVKKAARKGLLEVLIETKWRLKAGEEALPRFREGPLPRAGTRRSVTCRGSARYSDLDGQIGNPPDAFPLRQAAF